MSMTWLSRIFTWMKAHKVRTVLLLLGAYVFVELLTIPFFSVARLKNENPAETALMRQRIKEAEGEKKPLKIMRQWVPLSRLPRHVVDAVVVAEDGTFFSHDGFDWYEVQESIGKNINEGRVARGASTITQQLAKNLYLSTAKTPMRKVKEVIITLLLEHYLSKNRILELYLNVIEWGRGVFGVGAAAQTYFNKSASLLSLDEATRLAAVIPSPLRHHPNEDSKYVMRRRRIVLNRMTARNHASPGQSQVVPADQMPMESVDSTTAEEDDENGL